MSREYDQHCSLACALDRIGERWSLLIVRELALGPLRFSDLVRLVGGAPTDVLTKRLRDLESHRIVSRRELEPPASGTVYELTEVGRDLERPMLELGRWGMHFEGIEEIVDLPPTSLANALRIVLRPPAGARMTVGLHSGSRHYTLRIAKGWVDARRGEAAEADLVLSGEPTAVLAALVVGEAGEADVAIEGDRARLAELRKMIDLPERLREAATAFVAAAA